MRFIEILVGIILFPLMVILGLVSGVIHVYKAFDHAFWTAMYNDD